MRSHQYISSLVVTALLALSCGPAAAVEFQTLKVVNCSLVRDPFPNPRYVPAPAWYNDKTIEKTASIVVDYNPSDCTGTTVAWPTDAQAAFQMAVDIWASILNGPETFVIDACWVTSLPANILGSTRSSLVRNFDNAPQQDTWYVSSLANQFADSDVNGADSEIFISFNANSDWYLGTGMQPTTNQSNFVTTVLHEIAHGLGVSGRMRVDDGVVNLPNNGVECTGTAGVGCWGTSGADPSIYDRFTENGAGTPVLNFANNSSTLGTQLTSDAIFFNGPTATILNGFTPPEIYAPAVWNPGSSYSHLGENFNNTDDALMTFSLSDGEVNHHPGDVILGLLQDLGWSLRNLSNVWVDLANTTGVEFGSLADPFNTVFEGVSAVYPDGTVYMAAGSYNENVEIVNSVILRGLGGTVLIGQ